jgi:uncharacterized protein (TIGR03435 family)
MILLFLATNWAFGQAEAPLKFEAADVHSSAKAALAMSLPPGPARGGRYEARNATMVDLVRIAYGFDADKILGGPSWLEMHRYDVIAKLPAGTTLETQKLMLQALLQERFKLVVHKDTKPLPAYALTAGKKLQLKEAAGTEESGCKVENGAVAGGGTIRMGAAVAAAMGVPATLNLGPGGTIQYHCRNMTMAAFAEGLRGMMGASSLGTNPVVDDTGLKGAWNFDVRWSVVSLGPNGETPERITVFDAVDKQLGLKLEERERPTPVLVVDGVNEKPTPNPPGTAEMLPTVAPPTAFEVASVKPADPGRMGGLMVQPGGRVTGQGVPMRMLLMRAFNAFTGDEIAELPAWVGTARFDITAKAPAPDPSAPPLDMETLAPMLRALLADRFKMTYHTEERQVEAYCLIAAKPKLKKADPASRTSCKFPNPPPGAPPGSRVIACQNVTMAQFADQLQRQSPELMQPVLDATGIDGTWDLTLVFNSAAGMMAGAGRGGGTGVEATASDPSGSYTIFEAMEKQLGLKLEKQKRPMQVFVIDRLEQKPTEN